LGLSEVALRFGWGSARVELFNLLFSEVSPSTNFKGVIGVLEVFVILGIYILRGEIWVFLPSERIRGYVKSERSEEFG